MAKPENTAQEQEAPREKDLDERLNKVVEEVRRDANDAPAEYLEETIVPAGGE